MASVNAAICGVTLEAGWSASLLIGGVLGAALAALTAAAAWLERRYERRDRVMRRLERLTHAHRWTVTAGGEVCSCGERREVMSDGR